MFCPRVRGSTTIALGDRSSRLCWNSYIHMAVPAHMAIAMAVLNSHDEVSHFTAGGTRDFVLGVIGKPLKDWLKHVK